ncbi:hypothetical protein OM427_12140 [Halomonas sp. 18H]|nr:hypothetical protein [Halomonas sp. 18H]MCW4150273.1 hypothetical protein [Halomonas sp. 18H]
MLRPSVKVVVSFAVISFLAGCTITGEPRIDRVAFDSEGYVVNTDRLRSSVSVEEVSEFPGTSNFTYSGRIAPNFSDDSFRAVLISSLENAELYGDSYSLNAKLIDSGDWSDWGIVWGTDTRRIEIEYTLFDGESVVFQDSIVSDIEMDINQFKPFYLMQRDVAEVNYAKNIELLIERLNSM